MKTKIMIWVSTLFAVAFISLATAEKAEAQTFVTVDLYAWYTPALHNGLRLVTPAKLSIQAVFSQPIGTSVTISGQYVGKSYSPYQELFIPFNITIPANISSSSNILIYSSDIDFEIAGHDIWNYSPTSWNGVSIIIR